MLCPNAIARCLLAAHTCTHRIHAQCACNGSSIDYIVATDFHGGETIQDEHKTIQTQPKNDSRWTFKMIQTQPKTIHA